MIKGEDYAKNFSAMTAVKAAELMQRALGLDVYRSDDLDTWLYQGKILDKPGTRNSDATIGKHADVVVCGDRAYIVYFTHPYTEDAPKRNGVSPLSNRHTAIQAAELQVRNDRLVCDRDKPFRIRLTPPGR